MKNARAPSATKPTLQCPQSHGNFMERKNTIAESVVVNGSHPQIHRLELPPLPELEPPPPVPTRRGIFLFLCGVLLPLIALGIELATRACTQEIVDPLPTPLHVFLVGFVPVSNWFLWRALYNGNTKCLSLLSVTSAATIGIAAFYTLVFLPILPLAAFAIILAGIGLLPLSPLLALLATLLGRRHLKRLNAQSVSVRLPHFLLGFSLGLLSLTVVELPSVVTRIGLQQAASAEAEKSLRGIQWLRHVGSQDVLLRHCYQEQRAMNDLLSLVLSQGDAITTEEARHIYYRVTGTPFNAVKPPSDLHRKVRTWGNDFEFDAALGGTTVAGQLKGLSLASSRQDQSLDANAAVSYTEWTMVFKNVSTQQREARAQIALPPGGVVSRLTLWVAGEEREAAFAGRAQVREAYNQVAVQQRRDPVLVTTAGTDRVLMQCFPVPSNGEMKVRLGITAPLQLESETNATLAAPYFLERNFGLQDDTQHSLWIESRQSLTATDPALKAELDETGRFALRGQLTDAQLSESRVRVMRTKASWQAWAPDTQSKTGEVITQRIEPQPAAAPARVVFVVDGSRSLQDYVSALAATVAKLPSQIDRQVFLATDRVVEVNASVLASTAFVGGNDNLPALLRAWDVAAEMPNSVIVWLHGPQPIEMQKLDALQQRYERRPNGPRLYDVQLAVGPNRLAEAMASLEAVEVVPDRLAGLARLLAMWNGTAPRYVVTRTKSASRASREAAESSSHLARLWALDEVHRLLLARAHNDDIIKLAARYQLVTPVTGAVVLETQAQYDRAGLQPVNPNTVPTIPEPETWALLFVVGSVLLWLLWQQRSTQRQAV